MYSNAAKRAFTLEAGAANERNVISVGAKNESSGFVHVVEPIKK